MSILLNTVGDKKNRHLSLQRNDILFIVEIVNAPENQILKYDTSGIQPANIIPEDQTSFQLFSSRESVLYHLNVSNRWNKRSSHPSVFTVSP